MKLKIILGQKDKVKGFSGFRKLKKGELDARSFPNRGQNIILSEVGFEPTPTEVDCDLNAAP